MLTRMLLPMACAALIPILGAQAQPVSCDNVQTQVELNLCANQAHQEADNRLNRVYKVLMNEIDGEVRQLTREGQRAWMTFRDKECLAQAGGSRTQGSGSMWPMLYSLCLADLSNQRAQQIENRLSCDSDDPGC